MLHMKSRDLIVIGASIGGIETIPTLLAQLPDGFPAAVLIVQHVSPGRENRLAALFTRSCKLPVVDAKDKEPIQVGHVYLAPPDHHLLVVEGHMRVGRGPRENRSRPAVDPLFRSAAVTGRNRTIGVILSGSLDDGASGLDHVHQCGGTTVVQDPNSAIHPGMPTAALKATPVDFVVPIGAMGALLKKLVEEVPPPAPEVPPQIALEARMTERALEPGGQEDNVLRTREMGDLTAYTCPDCGGPLWQMSGQNRFRCHVGHAYSVDSLLCEQDAQLEYALWAAVRSLEARHKMLETLAQSEESRAIDRQSRYREDAQESQDNAKRIREVLMQFSRH